MVRLQVISNSCYSKVQSASVAEEVAIQEEWPPLKHELESNFNTAVPEDTKDIFETEFEEPDVNEDRYFDYDPIVNHEELYYCSMHEKLKEKTKIRHKFIRAYQIDKEEKRNENMEYHIEKKKTNRWNNIIEEMYDDESDFEDDLLYVLGEDQSELVQQEVQAIRQAMLRSSSEIAPCGLSYRLLHDLQTRELTAEDFAALSELDATVAPKTIPQEQIQTFSTRIIQEDSTESCSICMNTYTQGEELRTLYCGHEFHSSCIDNWLLNCSTRCPIDNLEI
jgi:hypothetical protein